MARVGIDYWPAPRHAPGIGRYVRELVRALVRLPEAPELALFDVGPGRALLEAERLGLTGVRARRLRLPAPRRVFGPRLARAGLGADRWLGGVPLFHRAFPALPRVSRAAEVLPVAELPSAGSPADRELTAAVRRARAVIVFSRAAATAVADRYDVDPARVTALPVGCDHWLRDLGGAAPALRPRILALGATDRRRAPLALLAAFELLLSSRSADVPSDLELCFAGRPGDAHAELSERARSGPARPTVRFIQPAEAELPELVASSAVVAHLAREEWTPVTPLEACALGPAVVASRMDAFEEALGDLAEWVEPTDLDADSPQRLTDALSAGLTSSHDPAARALRRERAGAFTWQRHARLTLDVWNRILSA